MADSAYFFDQPVLLKRQRRRRKLPDELPRSLRFANLPPTLAAFLTSQERQKLRHEGGEFDDLFNFDFDGDGRDFLPNLSNEAQVFRNLRRHGSDDSLASENGEYSQKQYYHEAISIAPTLLVQLGAILYLFKKEHLDLPSELVNDLQGHYKYLTQQAQFSKLKWQCTDNILKELQEQQEAAEAEEGEEGEVKEQNGENKPDGENKPVKKKRQRKLDAGGEGAGHSKEIIQHGGGGGRSKSNKKLIKKSSENGTGNNLSRKASTLRGDVSGSGETSSSGTPQGGGTGGAGLHQPNFLQVISFSMSSKACEDKGWILSQNVRDKVKEENEQRNILEICLEKLKEALTHIKLDSGRYRELGHDKTLYNRYYGDTKREAMQKYISKRTTTGKSPNFMTKAQIMPPKVTPATPDAGQTQLFYHSLHDGSATALPKVTPATPDAGQTQLFYHSLHDGSATAFYPSGRLAAVVCRAGSRLPGTYTLVYEDDEEKTLLASFTPTGHGCCYHPNGLTKFLSTEKEGILFDTDGAETKKWDWMLPHLKLPNPVIVSINDHFTLRCHNRNQMTIVFSCHKETAKLHVGQVLTAVVPVTQEELGYLVTEEEFQSKSAEECIEPPPAPIIPKKKDKKPKNKLAKPPPPPPPKPVFQIGEIAKSLEMEGPTEYNIPAEKELLRLQRRAKNSIENWMDHYRIAVGIRSSHLNRIKSSVPHHRKRGIHSAKPTMDSPGVNELETDEEDDFTFPRATVNTRSPSAPPVSYEQRRRMSTMSAMSRQSRQRTYSTNSRLKSAASTAGGEKKAHFDPDVSLSKPWNAQTRPSTAMSNISGPVVSIQCPTPHTAWTASPTRTASASPAPTPNLTRRKTSPLIGCPVALRAEMLGDSMATCRCSRHKVPSIGDLELERYLKECVPRTQLIVIAVVSALFPEALPCHDMFSKFYDRQQRNRAKPCYQSRTDPYRLLVYDVVSAVHLSGHKQPKLLQRHNAVPGMFMIYAGGKLVFCDNIFNGYGNAKRDFQKQLLQSRQDASLGNFLPADFKFNPSRGRRGLRSAWGGEIGGMSVDRQTLSGLPSLFSIHGVTHGATVNNGRRSQSPGRAISPETRASVSPDPYHQQLNRKHGAGDRRYRDTAAQFLSLSLNHTNNLVALAL
ncbi:uncharacterized protein [Amphiura filiformis]|uniref:uncharacterized protein n=1 Tax=Amphiura filiformis TaxID=82378 RepID=UPI003B20D06C